MVERRRTQKPVLTRQLFERVITLDRLLSANLRLGRTPEERLVWVLTFAQRDLTRLSEGDWLNLTEEMTAFILTSHVPRLFNEEEILEFGKAHPYPVVFSPEFLSTPPSREEIQQLQTEINGVLTDLLTQGRVEIGKLSMEVKLYTWGTPPKYGLSENFEDLQSAVLYRICQLWGAHGDRVKRCPACQRLFVAGRPNQHYCSPRCQNRVKVQEYRKRLRAGITAKRGRRGKVGGRKRATEGKKG